MRKLTLIQVGLGNFGRRWMEVALKHPDWKYVAVATPDGSALAECGDRARLPTESRFTSLRDVFDSGIRADAVLVTTPHFCHEADAAAALDNGCNVLIEKPLAGTMDGAARIHERSVRSGRVVMVAENYRFGDSARLVRRLVAEGNIGTPELISLNYIVRHRFPEHDWRNDYLFPVLVENSTHHFDLVRFISGCNATEVFCSALASRRTADWPWPTVLVQVGMENGLAVDYTASWAYGEFETPWEGEWNIYGTQGSLRWTRDEVEVRAAVGSRQFAALSKDSDHTLAATLEEFTEAVATKRPSSVDTADNLNTIGIVFAAIESARKRRIVTMPEILGQSLFPTGAPG